MIAGVLAIDKPVGPTSHDAVDRARRSLGTRRIGHFGTLDPFASGLLVLGIGPATRLASFCADHAKTYRATIRLGERSDTDDVGGTIVRAPTGSIPDLGAGPAPTRDVHHELPSVAKRSRRTAIIGLAAIGGAVFVGLAGFVWVCATVVGSLFG